MVGFQTGSTKQLHYLPDFLFICLPGSGEFFYVLTKFQVMCWAFGIPLAHEKLVLPITCLEFLGVTIYIGLMHFPLPLEKVSKLLFLVDFFSF